MKHSGMFVFLQRFAIKKRQNEFSLGTLPSLPLSPLPLTPPAFGSFDFMIGVFQQPGTWRLEAKTALGWTGVNHFIE